MLELFSNALMVVRYENTLSDDRCVYCGNCENAVRTALWATNMVLFYKNSIILSCFDILKARNPLDSLVGPFKLRAMGVYYAKLG